MIKCYKHKKGVTMGIKIISLSIDEEVIKKADEMAKSRLDISNRSHLITTLILKEHKRWKKESK